MTVTTISGSSDNAAEIRLRRFRRLSSPLDCLDFVDDGLAGAAFINFDLVRSGHEPPITAAFPDDLPVSLSHERRPSFDKLHPS